MQMRSAFFGIVFASGVLLYTSSAEATVKTHSLFSNGMVLQQGKKVPVWGRAAEGENVTVKFQNQEVSTTAKDGKWQVTLEKLKAGGPFEMTISGTNKVTLKNVLVGEVWICSGQSNMWWPVNMSDGADHAARTSKNPKIRLFTVPGKPAGEPQSDIASHWQECNPATVPSFSAVAYYFGKNLQEALKVPVGLIHTSVGGTPAEAWTSKSALEAKPELKYYVNQITSKPANGNVPTSLYNGMIAPLIPYAIKGAIWYQGESNAMNGSKAFEYRSLFAAMIEDWRREWKQGDFPFLFVQLAPFYAYDPNPQESFWAVLREAQLLTLKLPKTGMAVITDIGDQKDIHPKAKAPVGERLALGARAIAYGQKIEYSGPVYDQMNVEGDKVTLSFNHVDGGLEAREVKVDGEVDGKQGQLKGFTIAGADRKFHNATAQLKDNKVVVWSSDVSEPKAVRYGWSNYPVVNLWNKAGLPASPFRTDHWPVPGQPRK